MAPRSTKFGSPSAQVLVSNSADLYHGPCSNVVESRCLTYSYKFHSRHEYLFLFISTMVVVAFVGGKGGLGRAVLDATAKAGEHKAIVLSRTVSSPALSLQCNGVKNRLFRQ